jgi:dephospho-CoA kinase
MRGTAKKPVIGILGAIASGKSTVAAEFARLGCAVIDADGIARELLAGKNVAGKITAEFGGEILDGAGAVDRGKLAEKAFNDTEKLKALNAILHPLILARARRLISLYQHREEVPAIVLDMPLLAEVGWADRCDRLVFVDCGRQIRAKRAREKAFLGEKQLNLRENFQIPLDIKRAIADNIVDNSSGLSALVRQVAEIFSSIVNSE